MVVGGLTKRLLRTEHDHDRLELDRERLKGRTKQERLGETKRVNESGYMVVKLESNHIADRRVHGDREVEVERTRRRDESEGWLKVSRTEERRYEQSRVGQKPRDVDASTKNWTLSTTRWKKTRSDCPVAITVEAPVATPRYIRPVHAAVASFQECLGKQSVSPSGQDALSSPSDLANSFIFQQHP